MGTMDCPLHGAFNRGEAESTHGDNYDIERGCTCGESAGGNAGKERVSEEGKGATEARIILGQNHANPVCGASGRDASSASPNSSAPEPAERAGIRAGIALVREQAGAEDEPDLMTDYQKNVHLACDRAERKLKEKPEAKGEGGQCGSVCLDNIKAISPSAPASSGNSGQEPTEEEEGFVRELDFKYRHAPSEECITFLRAFVREEKRKAVREAIIMEDTHWLEGWPQTGPLPIHIKRRIKELEGEK